MSNTPKRYNDALAISCGACNPSGIAYAIISACAELRDEPDFTGTDQISHDPAIRLMVSQLSFIVGNGEMPVPAYEACLAACRMGRDNAAKTTGSDTAKIEAARQIIATRRC